MKRYYKILVLLAIIPTYSFSQEIKVEWAAKEKNEIKKSPKIYNLGYQDGKYVIVQDFWTYRGVKETRAQKIEVLDKNLKKVADNKMKDHGILEDPFLINNKVCFFRSDVERINENLVKLKILITQFELNGVYHDQKVLIEKEIELGTKKSFKYSISSVFSKFKYSEDKKKIGIATIIKGENAFVVANSVLETSSLKSQTATKVVAVNQKNFNKSVISDLAITNEGDIICAYGYNIKEGERYLYSLIQTDYEGNFTNPIKLKFEDIYLGNLEIEAMQNDFIVNGFLISEKKGKNFTNGFFICKVDNGGESLQNLNPFVYNKEFFESLGYKVKTSGEISFNGYFDLDFRLNNDGNGFLLAEHIAPCRALETIVIPFNKDCELLSSTIVFKNQEICSSNRVSVGLKNFSFVRNNSLYILYNDLDKNMEINRLDELNELTDMPNKNSSIYLAKISADNTFKKVKLFSHQETEGFLVPNKCFDTGSEVIIGITDLEYGKYGKLILD